MAEGKKIYQAVTHTKYLLKNAFLVGFGIFMRIVVNKKIEYI